MFSVGSGSSVAYATVDAGLPALLSAPTAVDGRPIEDDAVSLAVRAIRRAVRRDGHSGGAINVLKVDRNGCTHLLRVDSAQLEI